MRTLISLSHISLDGFMADVSGDFRFVKYDDELASFGQTLIRQVDTAVYGRTTFELMEGYWPTAGDVPDATPWVQSHARWYRTVHQIVASRTLESTKPNVRVVTSDIVDVLRAEKQKPGGDIMIFASPTLTHTLTAAGLVDEWRLTINPVALGAGLPLWKEKRTDMELRSTKVFNSGVIAAHYITKR